MAPDNRLTNEPYLEHCYEDPATIGWRGWLCSSNLQPERERFCTFFEVHHSEYRSLINHIKINKLPAISPFGSLTENLLLHAIYHQSEVPTMHLCVVPANLSPR